MKNPFDGGFKFLAEEHPEPLLRLLRILEPGTKPQIIDIIRELQLEPVAIDHGYKIGEGPDARIVHLEAFTWWRDKRIGTMSLYNFLLKYKHKIPVFSYVLFMVEKLLPSFLPPKLIYEEPDGQMIATPYRVVKLWEVDPAVAFEPGHAGLLEWVPLLKGGRAEMDEACRRIEYLADHPAEAPHPPLRMATNIVLNASLRYDRNALGDFLERIRSKMLVAPDIWEASWIYQDARAEGKLEGQAEGEAKGEAKGKRSVIRRVLLRRFPSEVFPDIESLSNPEALDDLALAVVEASNPGQVRDAIAIALASRAR